MTDLLTGWINGPGRVGGEPPTVTRICWRCGAAEAPKPAPLSGCTEKRGGQHPWVHDFREVGVDHPWADWTYDELDALANYLLMKAIGSYATARAFDELNQLDTLPHVRYSVALYTEKAIKRAQLATWVISELEARS